MINTEKESTTNADDFKKLEDIGAWLLYLKQSQKTFLIEKGLERHCLDYPKDDKNRFFTKILY